MSIWLNKEMALFDMAEMITNINCSGVSCSKCPFISKYRI